MDKNRKRKQGGLNMSYFTYLLLIDEKKYTPIGNRVEKEEVEQAYWHYENIRRILEENSAELSDAFELSIDELNLNQLRIIFSLVKSLVELSYENVPWSVLSKIYEYGSRWDVIGEDELEKYRDWKEID